MDKYQAFFEMVKKWTVNDYQTQGIKSEVILDMLISEFIEEMVASELGEKLDAVKLLVKEFPIRTVDKSLRNAKVDYLVQVGNKIYLTELKTSNESLKPTQEANMQNAVDRKTADLWYFFRQIVTGKSQNSADGKKYSYTLTRLKEKAGLSELEFIPKSLADAELDILYICLHETPQSGKFFQNRKKHFYLENLSKNRKFISYLETRGKNESWDMLKEILSDILDAAVKFEGGRVKLIKTKTFSKNNAKYKKFFKKMTEEYIEPGLVSIDEEDLSPFKEFTGSVYMGEAEAAGENALEIAAKEAISKAENFAAAKEVLVRILGSSDKVNMLVANETIAAVDKIVTTAESIFVINLDDSLGDTVQVSVVAKIP